MRISAGPFAGMIPKVADYLLPNNAAVSSTNCIFSSGELQPLKDNSFVWTPTKIGTINTIWLYQNQYWFHWLEDVDVVESPVSDDSWGRVYWTGEAEPRYADSTLALAGGGTNYPNGYYVLGVPVPSNVPTQVAGTPSDANNIQSRAYIYTYVSAYGEEGAPTDPSSLFDTTDGDSVTVTCPDTGPSGAYNIVAKNIYRLNDGVYQFLTQIPAVTASFVDTIKNIALGDGITSTEYDPPPTDLKDLFVLSNGSIAGFTNNKLCISEPYLPHAWPVKNRIAFEGGIVSAGAYGNSILVTTANSKPYILSGNDPSMMFKEQFEVGHACMSKRGTVDMGNNIIYPSPFGLVVVGTGQAGILTEKVIGTRDWVSYANPTTLRSAKYGENYIGFNSGTKGFVFNTTSGDLSEIGFYATATYTDPGSGELYMVVNGDIVKFDDSVPLLMSWSSKKFMFPGAINFSRARVIADDYPVTLEIFANGTLSFSGDVFSNDPFTLPGGFMATDWSYSVSGKYGVRAISIANSVGEL